MQGRRHGGMEIGPGRVQDSGSEEWAFKNAYVAPCGDASESKLQKLGGGPELSVEPHRPDRHTQVPYVTGGSVVGLKYNGGVMIGADMLASYGATKRYKSIERVRRATDNAVVGATGEVGDFNYVCRLVEQMDTDDFVEDDGAKTQPRALHSFLQRVQYNRRTRLDPLWQSLVVAGVGEDMKPFLGCIGMIGQSYEDDHVATGFGAHMARPLLREKHSPSMAKDDAEVLLCDCLRVLFYRDKNTINKFQIATVDSRSGVSVSDPFALSTTWSFSRFHNPAELLQGTW